MEKIEILWFIFFMIVGTILGALKYPVTSYTFWMLEFIVVLVSIFLAGLFSFPDSRSLQ